MAGCSNPLALYFLVKLMTVYEYVCAVGRVLVDVVMLRAVSQKLFSPQVGVDR